MFKKDQGAEEPGEHWSGPMRIIGFDGQTVWGQFNAGTSASAVHLLRPPTAAELFALCSYDHPEGLPTSGTTASGPGRGTTADTIP